MAAVAASVDNNNNSGRSIVIVRLVVWASLLALWLLLTVISTSSNLQSIVRHIQATRTSASNAWLSAVVLYNSTSTVNSNNNNNNHTTSSTTTSNNNGRWLDLLLSSNDSDHVFDGGNMSGSLLLLLQRVFENTQNQGVWDEDDNKVIDPEREKERCRTYNFGYDPDRTKRRRIFWGSLIADDSWHVLALAAMEGYGIFDTVALVESNTTQMLYPRGVRFVQEDSNQFEVLRQMWGPNTRVSVDYYVDPPEENNKRRGLGRENLQRDIILQRWKENGMKHDDIGYLGDVDEVATRDFLRALQICNVPQFRPGQDCRNPKLMASTLVFEGSPMCIQQGRRWYHPDMVIGECVDKIGNETLHKPVVRNNTKYGCQMRMEGWKKLARPNGPLWDATDFRMDTGSMISGKRGLHTAFHFHNFFGSISTLRNKYKTYGHPVRDALSKPLGLLHPGDVGFMVDCLMERSEDGNSYKRVPGGWRSLDDRGVPIAFRQVPQYAYLRHRELQKMMAEDEKNFPPNPELEHPK